MLYIDKDGHCIEPGIPNNSSNARLYSRARLIRTANARKNCANCPSMRIIRYYFTLRFYQLQPVVSRARVKIKRGVRISEGLIIQAILYLLLKGMLCDRNM